jgi:hypothetical protein
MVTRRSLIGGMGAAFASAAVGKASLGALPEIVTVDSPATRPPLEPPNGRPYLPVATLNGWTLPWRMREGVKEFHLVAEPVEREIAPGMRAHLWGAFPGIDPMVARRGERVRIRVGSLTMTNHPIHLHGHEFEVVGTDGGWVPPSARWPEVTADIAVGQMRAIEFTAAAPGDTQPFAAVNGHAAVAYAGSYPRDAGGPFNPCRRPDIREYGRSCR